MAERDLATVELVNGKKFEVRLPAAGLAVERVRKLLDGPIPAPAESGDGTTFYPASLVVAVHVSAAAGGTGAEHFAM